MAMPTSAHTLEQHRPEYPFGIQQGPVHVEDYCLERSEASIDA